MSKLEAFESHSRRNAIAVGRSLQNQLSRDLLAAHALRWLVNALPQKDLHLEHLEHEGWRLGTCFEKGEGGWSGWIRGRDILDCVLKAARQKMGKTGGRAKARHRPTAKRRRPA